MTDEAKRPDGASAPAASPLIGDAHEQQRYEAHLDGGLAGVLEYVVRRDRIVLVHTEVSPDFQGRGVASALIRFALDDARSVGRRVIAACPYVRQYLSRHPEDLDIVIGNVKT